MGVQKTIFLVCGDENFAVKTRCRKLITELCGENFEENPSLDIIHGDKEEKISGGKLLGSVIESLSTPAFLGSDKVVWMKNFDFEDLIPKQSKSGSKSENKDEGKKRKKSARNKSETEIHQELFDQFSELIKSGLPEGVKLVISFLNIDKRSSLYKIFAKSEYVEIIDFESGSDYSKNQQDAILSFTAKFALELGIKLSPDAADFLIEACAGNRSRIINEIEKIAAYIYPNKEASLNDCIQVCSMTPEMASWAFTEAILRKDISAAMKALDILLTPKNPEIAILSSLITLYSDLAQVKIVAEAIGAQQSTNYIQFEKKLTGCPLEIKDKFSWTKVFSMKPYRAFKINEQASKIPDNQFARIFQNILDTYKKLVSGAENPRLELENLAAELCRKNL